MDGAEGQGSGGAEGQEGKGDVMDEATHANLSHGFSYGAGGGMELARTLCRTILGLAASPTGCCAISMGRTRLPNQGVAICW